MEIAKKVCIRMLTKRGWICDDIDDTEQTLTGYITKDQPFIVFMLSISKLNIAHVKEFIKILTDLNIKHCIIIYNNNITSSAKRIITNIVDIVFELFSVKELQFDITQHRYYRPHRALNNQEYNEFTKNTGHNIPVLQKTDPICRYFNFERGSIIEVTRKDDYISYRIVK